MDIFLIILGAILSFIGIVGCIIPGLPGPPFNFLAMLCLLKIDDSISSAFIIFWLIVTILVTILDYFIPVLFAKKYGATKLGIVFGICAMLIGMFFSPVGMIAGLIIGSIVGDVVAGKDINGAIRSGLGGAVGTLLTIGLKIFVSVWMTAIFFRTTISYVSEVLY